MYFEEIKIIKNHRQNSGFSRKTSFWRILPAHTLLHTGHFRLNSNFVKMKFLSKMADMCVPVKFLKMFFLGIRNFGGDF